jgi:1-acyl-sn-glycerol-3-phosphate acyltransferase
MKWIKGILGYVWKIYFFLVVLITVIVLFPLLLIFLLNEKYFNTGHKLVSFQAKLILFLVGVRSKIHGNLPKDGRTYIVCSNHSSYLDILLLYAVFPNYLIFLGKKELGDVPLFNIYFKKMNILVDRGNPKASHESIKKAVVEMSKGRSVVIFPEGTIPETAPVMKAFKNGAFKVAIENGIPILPISFPNNSKLLEDKWNLEAKSGPGKANIYFHNVIESNSDEFKDLITLREKTKELIQSKL